MLQWINLVGLSFLGLSLQFPSHISNPSHIEQTKELKILSIDLIVDSQKVRSSISVRGEDRRQPLYFKHWLVPFDQIIQALGLIVSNLENGQLGLRFGEWFVQLHPDKLKIDPELGLVLSVEDITTLLHVTAQFDMIQSAVVLIPPWQRQTSSPITPLSIFFNELPEIHPAPLSFTALQQQTSLAQNKNDLDAQGHFMSVGTLGQGSWYLHTNQTELLKPKRWQLEEAQIFWKQDAFDVAIGSQPTFWQSRHQDNYWGATFVKRTGFHSILPSSGGFEPSERRQTDQVTKTIIGEAEPGTLVRLIDRLGGDIIAEVLVDTSGIYRFEKVLMTPQENREYHVLLYPHGLLTMEPEIRQARAVTQVDQLEVGASALIFSIGKIHTSTDQFLGEFDDLQAGIGYRIGLTDTLTLGGGLISDKSLQPWAELSYQPLSWFPLALGITALKEDDDLLYNAEMAIQFSKKLAFYFNSDPLAKRFQWLWSPIPGLSLFSRGNSRTEQVSTGVTLSRNTKNFGGVLTTEVDTRQQTRWNLTGYLKNYKLKHIADNINTSTRLSYNFSGYSNSDQGHSLFLNRESKHIKEQRHQLNRFGWHYQSAGKSWEGKELWEIELGYSRGTHGNGVFATFSTEAFPGITLQCRYQNVSITSDAASFFLEIVSRLNIQPQFDRRDQDIETLRGEGGIMVYPFIDRNKNGVHDLGEKIYIDQAEQLFTLNHQSLDDIPLHITSQGISIQLPVGTYQLDLNPTAYPVHTQPLHSAYAVSVVAGGYSSVFIPFIPSPP